MKLINSNSNLRRSCTIFYLSLVELLSEFAFAPIALRICWILYSTRIVAVIPYSTRIVAVIEHIMYNSCLLGYSIKVRLSRGEPTASLSLLPVLMMSHSELHLS